MSTQTTTGRPIRNASPWIKAFVAFHIVCITMWALPYPKKPYRLGTAKLGIDSGNPQRFVQSFSETTTEGFLYLNWRYLKGSPLMYYPGTTGFWQFWDMFSPNPASVDLYLTADVEYKSGKKIAFEYPRIYNLPIWKKYLKERYRKFYENANADDQAQARPYVAQRIALEACNDLLDPPIKVTLIRHFYPIAAPGQPQPKDYTTVPFFTYMIDQAKLRSDFGASL
jgi:hypothetical protein